MEFIGRSVNMNPDERAELQEKLAAIHKNGDGYIDLSELKEALNGCGFELPGWKVRQMIEEYDDKRQMQRRD
jgi:plastin-3